MSVLPRNGGRYGKGQVEITPFESGNIKTFIVMKDTTVIG